MVYLTNNFELSAESIVDTDMDSINCEFTNDSHKIKSFKVKISLFNNDINSKESAEVLCQPY